MPFCKVGQLNIYYEDIGEGIPVLMIHGFSPDHRLMKGCMEPVFKDSAGWRRIYIDLPGMGKTENYSHIRNSDEMAEAILLFIDTMLPDQPFLIAGESYGGYLARAIINNRKKQILGAAFICPVIFPEKEDRILPQHTVVFKDHQFVDTLTEEEAEDFSSNQVVLDEYNWVRYSSEVLSGCKIADQDFLSKIQDNYGFSFNPDEGLFEKPSVFLLGKQDSVVGYQNAIDLMDKFPRSTFAVLDRAGHNLQIEQSRLFTLHIIDWLERVKEFND
ncbi:alpha/beta hydrolase [Bacillus sp. MUM 13]|uniref:alpha/beta fold hydrolase n=1 Tax=Bacillus sp. MUM 13 TaxID=1678001 RepID=UPI0008F5C937|nr:alpha/beta hydrolase [Bacillus sp. MUM 13]OIK11292.1 2-hydroxy-6-oxo-6-phenylhexa-2,4-dienoate hydrolase [Bacillus sp. MUM 13]